MSIFDRFFGRGAHSITVPALDGAFRPNETLDTAQVLAEAPGAQEVAEIGGALAYAAGPSLFRPDHDAPTTTFEADIAFLVAVADGGICGLVTGDIFRIDAALNTKEKVANAAVPCPTSAVALDNERLIVASGSSVNGVQDWQRDLLEKRKSGALYEIDLATGNAKTLVTGLAWPAGIARHKDELLVSEAWAARLVTVPLSGGAPKEVLGNLPGYPGSISKGPSGYWLGLFAPRNQLLEFVLREGAYREAMMAEIAPEYWIAPTLRSGVGFLAPLQAGGVRQLGVLKPWAPMLSFGLVALLDEKLIPQHSFHSRADGHAHGITAVVEHDNQLIFASKGDGKIGALSLKGNRA